VPRSFIDHIVVTAPTLALGATYVRDTLGVAPQPGGEHARMGTHNLLLRLGDALYLEVIATNPHAPPPGRPRWFALDALDQDSAAALTSWVVRTTDIQARAAACTEKLGNVEPMSRGALNWQITIPADGLPPLNGLAPALIEWQTDGHPAARLADHGLSLVRLELFHAEPQRVARMLSSLELDGPLAVALPPAGRAPFMVAHINTPQGLRALTVDHAAN
jgi:hypothetical protein